MGAVLQIVFIVVTIHIWGLVLDKYLFENDKEGHGLVQPPSCSLILPISPSIIHCPKIPAPSNLSHSPLVWIHCDGPWLAQVSAYEHFPLSAVSCGDGDAFVARVRPVDVLMDPVDSQALRGVKWVDERHLLRWVTGLIDVSTVGWCRSVSVSILEAMKFRMRQKMRSR